MGVNTFTDQDPDTLLDKVTGTNLPPEIEQAMELQMTTSGSTTEEGSTETFNDATDGNHPRAKRDVTTSKCKIKE